MSAADYTKTRRACYFCYLAMSSVFSLPPILFVTFHEMYGVSFTLLGTLVLINFCTQLSIDLVFTFFSKYFNIRRTIRIMPLLTALGLTVYALIPFFQPKYAYAGLAAGTVIFSVAAGLCEVLLSPLIASIPSDNPERDMSMLHSLYGWGVVTVVALSSLYFLIFGTENWVYLTLFWAILPLIASLLFFLSPIPEQDVSSPPTGGNKRRSTGILLCVLCIFLGSCAENAMTNWISGFLESALSVPKAVGDILGMAVFALLLAASRNLYGKFTPDISKTLLFSMIGASVCYLVAGASAHIIPAFLACILTGCCTSMLWPGTLILMEEKIPNPGVAAYALMAAGGDFGASIAPQLLGYLVDRVSESRFAAELSLKTALSPEQIGMKFGMVTSAVYPILGTILLLFIIRYFRRNGKAEKAE